jgi:feruloyl-CoA synthase
MTPLGEVLHSARCRPASSRGGRLAARHRQRQPHRALCLLAEPPSIDKGEITDKGSINQRAVLKHRDAWCRPCTTAPLPHISNRPSAPKGT